MWGVDLRDEVIGIVDVTNRVAVKAELVDVVAERLAFAGCGIGHLVGDRDRVSALRITKRIFSVDGFSIAVGSDDYGAGGDLGTGVGNQRDVVLPGVTGVGWFAVARGDVWMALLERVGDVPGDRRGKVADDDEVFGL